MLSSINRSYPGVSIKRIKSLVNRDGDPNSVVSPIDDDDFLLGTVRAFVQQPTYV